MQNKNLKQNSKSVYERLEGYGFETAEIDEAMKSLLMQYERNFWEIYFLWD